MSSFSDELYKEIDARIAEIESPDYKYPLRFRKIDWIGMAFCAAVCLIGSVVVIIYGASL